VELRRPSGSKNFPLRGRSVRVAGVVLILLILGIALAARLRFEKPRVVRDPRSRIQGRLCGVDVPTPRAARGFPGIRSAGPDWGFTRLRDLLEDKPARAVLLLERAVGNSPQDSRGFSDLSAAYLTRAVREGRPEDLARGLAAALQALHLDPGLPEAAFNRALALEKLWLKGAAIEAWEACARTDPDAEWRREAEQHRQALAQPAFWQSWRSARSQLAAAAARRDEAAVTAIVRAYPQPAREFAETQELGAWGDAIATGDAAGARRALWLAETTGHALAGLTGDFLVSDAVETIRRAATAPEDTAALARGHQSFRDGLTAYERLEIQTASPRFESANAALARGGSPLADWPAFYAAVCASLSGPASAREAALETFRRIARDPRHARHPILAAHAEWMIARMLSDRGSLGESLDHGRRALHLFETTSQAQGIATVHDLLAHDLDLLGDSHESWAHLAQALARSDQVLKRRWVSTILQKAAACALRSDQPAAALEFHQEAVRVVLQQENPLVVSEALISRSLSRLRLEDATRALADLDQARAWMAKTLDVSLRPVVEAELTAAAGKVLRKIDPVHAIAGLSRALDLDRQRGATVLRTELFVERGLSQLALGRDDLAEQDFAAGIENFEQNRRKIFAEGLRISYFEQGRSVFDEMIRLQLDRRNDPWRAFRLSEQARARELLDTLAGGDADRVLESLESGHAGRVLPADVVLVHYAILEDRTLIWVLTRDRDQMFERPGGAELPKRVGALVHAIRKRMSEARIRALSAPLYEDLIRPITGLLPPGSTLVLSPDRSLHTLPFAALFNANAGRYLIEEHPLALTPSGSLVLYGAGRQASLPKHPELRRALIVGNPKVDTDHFSNFVPLPGAETEARKIAALYPEPELLIGAAATHDRFLAAAGRNDVVHFAGHALSNQEFPLLSMLLLAPDPGATSSGALLAEEIYKQKLKSTRLVVLGACSTTEARISPSEGVLGLARPFLAAGVPNVVSTLWEVEDATTPALFEAFHRRLRAGDAPVQALRAAQLGLLRGADPSLRSPASWAPFEVIQGLDR
jgi:CHAT domain-containing protein